MVNPRLITSKLTKAESKDLLDKAQGFIDRNIKGEKFKRDELLKTLHLINPEFVTFYCLRDVFL